jgi:antitoxin component YwqK of YwqJK toxin-antitoxin module
MKIIFKFKYNLKMTNFLNESIFNFPKEINALISTYLEDDEGDYFRDKTEDFIIKEVRDGRTYGNGVLHSFNDMPAVIKIGSQELYKNGKKHRDESDGTQKWYKNGLLHRDNDMPAVIYINVFNKFGIQEWYKNGLLHRDNNMPAVIDSNGSRFWYTNGKLHRDNELPAVIYKNRTQRWYKNEQLIK